MITPPITRSIHAGNSSFSGVYRITQCDSTFSGGVFQQRLQGIRSLDKMQIPQVKRYNTTGNTTSANVERNSLLNTTKDVILNNVDKKTTNTVNANVVEEQSKILIMMHLSIGGT